MRYQIIKPDNYEKKPFPGLNKWTTLLRSGEYAQKIGSLCGGDEEDGDLAYCCLGILSMSQGRLNGKFDGQHNASHMASSSELSLDNPLVACGFVTSPIKLSHNVVVKKHTLSPHTSATTFVQMNDDLGLNFLEIADIADELYFDTEEQPNP